MKKIVTFGELMLRLAAPDYLRISQANYFEAVYGGGEANVAASLANFGLHPKFITRLPDNELGDAALMYLRKHGLDTSDIIRGGSRLGLYFLETGAVSRGSKVIYDREHSALATIQRGMIDWEKVFQGVDWFHWTGITPAISESAAMVCLEAIQAASQLGITVSTDLNYRKKLWKYGKAPKDVMPALIEGCDVILGNEESIEKYFGITPYGQLADELDFVDPQAYISLALQLKDRFPKAKKVVFTIRRTVNASHNTLSGILCDDGLLYQAPTYQITHIIDRVGGGDAFMGGLIYGLLMYDKDYQRALNFAVAASCLKHTIRGDFNLVNVQEVENLMEGEVVGRVSR
ncbi:2-dehydro-3-deoxygluconokinase [marine bacterium AO1-C]|nr:2-dehydro-3-deoxygluconokinase [marine bacterium AO1-C]